MSEHVVLAKHALFDPGKSEQKPVANLSAVHHDPAMIAALSTGSHKNTQNSEIVGTGM